MTPALPSRPSSAGGKRARYSRAGRAHARAGVYRLLAELYLAELDRGLLAALRTHDTFAATIGEDGGDDLLGRLRVEYARLFVMNVSPYESVYVDPEMMLNTATTQTVVDAYRAVGYTPNLSRKVGAPDHVGVELDLMRALAEREAVHLDAGDLAAADADRAHQRAFLAGHLASWGPALALSVVRDARLPLYREIGGFTAEFLLADLDLLAADRPVPGTDAEAPPPTCAAITPEMELRAIVRALTTPAFVGFHLSREALFRLARQLELPLASVERWLMLEQLFQNAARYGQLPGLLAGLVEIAERASATYAEWQLQYPGAAAAVGPWALRARAAAATLCEMQTAAATGAR